jgi:hypothetical protein
MVFQMLLCGECYEIFALKGVQTIHRSRCLHNFGHRSRVYRESLPVFMYVIYLTRYRNIVKRKDNLHIFSI